MNLCRNPLVNDKNDANAHHHNLAVHFHAMATQKNMKNLEVGARVRSVEKGHPRQIRSFLSRPLAVFVGLVVGAAPVAAFLIAEINQQNLALNDLERENKSLDDQVAALSNENKIKSEQLLDLSNKVLALQGKYARDVTALSIALDKAQEEVTVIFSEVDSREGLLNLPSDKSGSWFINFESYSDKAIADIRSKEIRDALVAVDISVVEGQAASGDAIYRIRATGFPNKSETERASIWIEQRLESGDLWIGNSEQEKEAARLKLDARRVLRYVVMVGEYAESLQAESVAKALTDNGLTARSPPFVDGRSKTFRVYIPDISTKDRAEAILRSLTKTGSFRGAKLMRSFNPED